MTDRENNNNNVRNLQKAEPERAGLSLYCCNTELALVCLGGAHLSTTTHTNDPIGPVKAAQTEIAPVLLCVREQQRYSTVFISIAFSQKDNVGPCYLSFS